MLRSILLLFALTLSTVAAGQSSTSLTLPVAPQPLKNVAPPPRGDQIQFVRFEIQEPHLYGLSVHYSEIEGRPSAGVQYGVEAVIGGDEAIASAALHVVDETGRKIEPVRIAAHATGASFEFLGLLMVPSQPFRILLEGETVDGKPFERLYWRLFMPTNEPAPRLPRFPADFPREFVPGFQQMFDELAPKTIAEREALVAANPSGRIVIPRFEISNVTYAPLVSAHGRPIGLRLSYDAEFCATGRYHPGLRVFAEDKEDFIVGRNPLHPLASAIVPRPRKTHAPNEDAEDVPGLLAQLTDYIYEAHTRYRFTVDLVPDFIHVGRDNVTPCFSNQRFELERDPKRAFARMLAHEVPTTYRVEIDRTVFESRIQNFYGEGTFYRNFIAEGLQNCADYRR